MPTVPASCHIMALQIATIYKATGEPVPVVNPRAIHLITAGVYREAKRPTIVFRNGMSIVTRYLEPTQ